MYNIEGIQVGPRHSSVPREGLGHPHPQHPLAEGRGAHLRNTGLVPDPVILRILRIPPHIQLMNQTVASSLYSVHL